MPNEERNRERLSAYHDGETSPRERAHAAKDLCRQPQERRRFGRYQLIGDVIRGDLPQHPSAGLSHRVREAIAQDDPNLRRAQVKWRRWFSHPLGSAAWGGAFALFLALGVWVYWGQQEAGPSLAEVEFDSREYQRLLGYMAAHAEIEPRALLPHTNLVDHEE